MQTPSDQRFASLNSKAIDGARTRGYRALKSAKRKDSRVSSDLIVNNWGKQAE